MAKFKIGDKARVVYVRKRFINSDWKKDSIVTITDVHIGSMDIVGDRVDYTIKTKKGTFAYPLEEQLEPIIDLSSWDEIEDSIGWNPTKQKENV